MEKAGTAYPKCGWFAFGMGTIGWICAVFFLIGLYLDLEAAFQTAKAWRLEANGVTVTGQVTAQRSRS